MVTASEFSGLTLEGERQWSNALSVRKERYFQAGILSPAKLLIKGKDRIKHFQADEVLKYLAPYCLSQEATRRYAPLKGGNKPRKQKTWAKGNRGDGHRNPQDHSCAPAQRATRPDRSPSEAPLREFLRRMRIVRGDLCSRQSFEDETLTNNTTI